MLGNPIPWLVLGGLVGGAYIAFLVRFPAAGESAVSSPVRQAVAWSPYAWPGILLMSGIPFAILGRWWITGILWSAAGIVLAVSWIWMAHD